MKTKLKLMKMKVQIKMEVARIERNIKSQGYKTSYQAAMLANDVMLLADIEHDIALS